jgi:hypothetical protein
VTGVTLRYLKQPDLCRGARHVTKLEVIDKEDGHSASGSGVEQAELDAVEYSARVRRLLGRSASAEAKLGHLLAAHVKALLRPSLLARGQNERAPVEVEHAGRRYWRKVAARRPVDGQHGGGEGQECAGIGLCLNSPRGLPLRLGVAVPKARPHKAKSPRTRQLPEPVATSLRRLNHARGDKLVDGRGRGRCLLLIAVVDLLVYLEVRLLVQCLWAASSVQRIRDGAPGFLGLVHSAAPSDRPPVKNSGTSSAGQRARHRRTPPTYAC